jgi:hypothetical protein
MSLQPLANHQRSRRALFGAALAGIGAVAAGRFMATAAHLATPEAETATLDALARTPLGEQLGWFLAAVNDGGSSFTEADVRHDAEKPSRISRPNSMLRKGDPFGRATVVVICQVEPETS